MKKVILPLPPLFRLDGHSPAGLGRESGSRPCQSGRRAPVAQGAATINGSGTSQVTINQTSANAFINWQTFNIVAGETTTFNQPSSSSVTWNYINDPNPCGSSINGTINANGYVILQNPNGFTVGGQATITAHGLVMTTASTPALNLSSGGPWSFNAPPPTAQIINSGQIKSPAAVRRF